jgi:hypothetical protein
LVDLDFTDTNEDESCGGHDLPAKQALGLRRQRRGD